MDQNQQNQLLEKSQIKYGNYIISDNILGNGAFGQVREGYSLLDKNIRLAFKIVEIQKEKIDSTRAQSYLQGYKRELAVYQKLSDTTHVLAYVDNFEEVVGNNQIYCLVTELCDGDLMQLLREEQGRISVDQALNYFQQILSGIKEMHNQQLMHRDIKPENILYVKQNNINVLKLGDFGISDNYQGAKSDNSGTSGYIDPNLDFNIDNFDEYLKISDIFSLGVTLYYILNYDPIKIKTDKLQPFPYKTKPIKDDRYNPKIKKVDYEYFKQNPITVDYLKQNMRADLQDKTELIEYILKMIQLDKKDRFTWEQLFSHKFSQYPKFLVQIQQLKISPHTQTYRLNEFIFDINKTEINKQLKQNVQKKALQFKDDQIKAVKGFTQKILEDIELNQKDLGISEIEINQRLKPAIDTINKQYNEVMHLFLSQETQFNDKCDQDKLYIIGLIVQLQGRTESIFLSQEQQSQQILGGSQITLIQTIFFLITIVTLETTFPFYEENPINILAWLTRWKNKKTIQEIKEVHQINKQNLKSWKLIK